MIQFQHKLFVITTYHITEKDLTKTREVPHYNKRLRYFFHGNNTLPQ